MTEVQQLDPAVLLGSRVVVPQHVVYMAFPSETVVLNLQTGRYHGLNVTAGRMLESLERSAIARDAVGALAREMGEDVVLVRRDMCTLCLELLDRGLIEIDADPAP